MADMARRYEGETGGKVVMAWNGGYVLNDLVVGRMGLRPECIGTPLGLVTQGGKVLCPPLYNRPALAVDREGVLSIRRVSLDFPGEIRTENPRSPSIAWRKAHINPVRPPDGQVAVYNLMYPEPLIDAQDRALIVLAGRIISRIVLPDDTDNGKVEMLPVGLHLSIPYEMFFDAYEQYYFEGMRVQYGLQWPAAWRNITDAVEAGPLLLRGGRVAIDLETEGWKTQNSIRTQAGRLDYEDLRGPKVGVGLTRQAAVVAVAVNGRIRDSVGATYHNLARILKEHGAVSAMGFDPGGSATLVLGGTVRNVPPNNPDYRKHPHSGPPVARPVMNAVLGTLDL